MPFLHLSGIPHTLDETTLQLLELQLKQAVASVPTFDSPGAEAEVICPYNRLPSSSKVIAVRISGVYKKPERDNEIMTQLRVAIAECLVRFVLLNTIACESVEVYPEGYRCRIGECEIRDMNQIRHGARG